MISTSREVNTIELPLIEGEFSMLPFDLKTLDGLKGDFKRVAEEMVKHLRVREGMAFLTVHGKKLLKSDTLRRGGAHIDGNYMNYVPGEPFRTFGGGGGNGWKLGQTGPYITTREHKLSYDNKKGGILMASNHSSSLGYHGTLKGKPVRGGDCTHMKLPKPFSLGANKVHYGNNQFVHESVAVKKDVHRVLFRITLPITHEYETA